MVFEAEGQRRGHESRERKGVGKGRGMNLGTAVGRRMTAAKGQWDFPLKWVTEDI